MNENFENGLENWINTENAQVITDSDGMYLRYKAEDTSDDVAVNEIYRGTDANIPSSSAVYLVEFDVRFEDSNSGVVELYSSANLGPTVIFDGSVIKTKTGNPGTYVTMYKNAEAGKWYNVKFLANGKSSVYGFTKAEDETNYTKTSKDVKRNLKNGVMNKIAVSNKVNGEDINRTGAVDVRDIKASKPLADSVELNVADNINTISVPATDTDNTAQYSIGKISYDTIDLSGYSPINQNLAKFALYDGANATDITNDLPKGIGFDSSSGLLTVSKAAAGVSEGTYNVRLSNYDDSVYDSKEINVVASREL